MAETAAPVSTFRVGATAEFGPGGVLEGILEDAVGDILTRYHDLSFEYVPDYKDEVSAGQISDFDAVITSEPSWPAASFADASRLALVAYWGVGYDAIDTEAATRNDVIVSLTTPAVRWPMAESVLVFMLALSKNLMVKSELARKGLSEERGRYNGILLRERTVGLIGLGNIGSAVAALLRPFDLKRLVVFDPYVGEERVRELGADLTDLETVMSGSDFVVVLCRLSEETRRMIGEKELRAMKPSAYLINAARGGIIDQNALVRALEERWIAGAALDVFEVEPPPPDEPLVSMANVIATPHCIGWTEELYRDNSLEDCRAVAEVYYGRAPLHVANPEVLERPLMQEKLRRFTEGRS